MDFTILAQLALLFLLLATWAIIWPHVKLSRQARQISEIERRLETAERALTLVLNGDLSASGAQARASVAPEPAHVDPDAAPAPDVAADTNPDVREDAAPSRDPDAPAWWPKGVTYATSRAHAEEPTPAVHPQPAPARSMEERLGARWSVLVGGAALALGALLLVRYSIEAGLLGPGARVVLGLLLGLGLIGAGQATRRRETRNFGRVSIPATLTAAGTVAIFGAIYAAHALYGFIGSATAFLLLGATGLGAMSAAALHGPMLAGLGLIGSYATPLMVESRSPAPWTLVVYLIIVSAAAYGLSRIRRWHGVALGAACGAALWMLALAIGGPGDPFAHAAPFHALAQVAMALGAFVLPFRGMEADRKSASTALGAPLALAALAVLTLVEIRVDEMLNAAYVGEGLALVALLSAGAWMAPVGAPLSAAAGVAAAMFAWAWPPVGLSSHHGHLARALTSIPDEAPHFLAFCSLASAVVAGAAFARLRRGGTSSLVSAYLGGAGAATPVALLGLAYARMTGLGESGAFAMAAGALAVVFALIAAWFRPQAEASEAARQGLGFAATGALAALAVGLSAALSGGSLTAAWGLSALAAAYVARLLDIAALRWGVAALGGVVAARLAWEPRVMRDIGTTPVFNWLLIGYGVPALAFAGAAWLMRRREDVPLQVARGLAVALAGFLVFFEIRHAMNGGDAYARAHSLVEIGLQTFSATMFAILLTGIGGAHPPAVYRWATTIAGALAALGAAGGLLLAANPFFSNEPLTRTGFFNELIPGYLLPALGAAGLAFAARPFSARKAQIAAASALILLFVFVSLETRAQFHDLALNHRFGVTQAESFAYSGVWLALGLAALAYGVARHSKEARLASAALVTLATVKIFVFDLAGLTGAWRAFSFIGLGLVLIGVGAVYQRLLFPRSAPRADAEGGEGV